MKIVCEGYGLLLLAALGAAQNIDVLSFVDPLIGSSNGG